MAATPQVTNFSSALEEAIEGSDEIAVYAEVNGELRRFYDYVVRSFEHLRNKALALLVGEVAVVTFLFQDFHLPQDKHQHVPVYGYAVLGLGIFLLIVAFGMFLFVISSVAWRFPTEEHDMKNPTERFKGNVLECYKYIHSEYLQKVVYCNDKILLFRAKRFMNGTYALSAGVLLIILIKYGGGA